MLQAKLFIICSQAFMRTDARVEGSYPFKARDLVAGFRPIVGKLDVA